MDLTQQIISQSHLSFSSSQNSGAEGSISTIQEVLDTVRDFPGFNAQDRILAKVAEVMQLLMNREIITQNHPVT
ncbi:hypothetical protein O6P43_033284 [Quillaja saponaria]|uniref:Uncharacterized protein n=1 Tax=Quillaja saponaria TaxID=32244 RepID=A0AAD7KQ68_QUISA|nr:hypothetical protein O6P43_033284 [Quillaja saponaria]